MKQLLLVVSCIALLCGCKTISYDSPRDGFPSDYRSQLYIELVGTGEVDFEYLGYGEGQSIGTNTKSYDKLAAYKQATGGDPNVILINSNSQVIREKTTYGPLFFLNTIKETYKIWGHKIRIKSIKSTPGKKPFFKPPTRQVKKEKRKGLFGFFLR